MGLSQSRSGNIQSFALILALRVSPSYLAVSVFPHIMLYFDFCGLHTISV